MEIQKNDSSIEILLKPEDVESAVREFIISNYPEYNFGWVLDSKYNVGAIIFSGTKCDEY